MASGRKIEEPAVSFEITIDGRAVSLDTNGSGNILEVSPGLYSVLYGGRSYEVRIANSNGDWHATIGGRSFVVGIRDPRNWVRRSGAELGNPHQDVKAPMPGKVIRMLVREGDDVHAGQGLAVVEAMKMQNELKALRAGRVLRVPAKDGDTVSAGDVLVTLE